jgi:hypothetical protein
LTAPTKPRFVALLSTMKFGASRKVFKYSLMPASGLASSTRTAWQLPFPAIADFSVSRQSCVASKSR